MLSARLFGGIPTVGCAAEPLVTANRLSKEGVWSVLPPLFLTFFRGESSPTVSRVFKLVLGPADVVFCAPRTEIPGADCAD